MEETSKTWKIFGVQFGMQAYTLQFSGNITFEDSKKVDNDLILTEYKTDKDTFVMTKETTTKIDDDSDEDAIEQPIALPTL